MSPSGVRFWDEKARTFPRFEEGDNTYEAGMLRLAREHGVVFSGKDILDVGCGSGMYTIRLAREAAHVTATDFSPEMLRILQEDAAAQGVTNIRCVQSAWMDFPVTRTHDVVFASMTPAVNDHAGRDKLLMHAHGWVVYMGWNERGTSDIMAGVLARHNITPRRYDAARQTRRWLEEKNMAHTSIPVRGRWDIAWNKADLLHSCTVSVMAYGVEPDTDFIASHLETFRTASGAYREQTDYVIEMLLWQTS